MKNKDLEQLKNDYNSIAIPAELDATVKNTLAESGVETSENKKSKYKRLRITITSIAAAFILVIAIGSNSSPAFAKTFSDVPVLKSIVKVLTFREFNVNEGNYEADIKTPSLSGFEKNKTLEDKLNKKYLAEDQKLYDDFMKEMNGLKSNGSGGYLGVDSGYVIKTDTDRILSIGRYVDTIQASGAETIKYDTIDKKNEVLITLPSLFKNDKYIDIISKNIKEQMLAKYKADNSYFYFVKGISDDECDTDLFEHIDKNQDFYITPEGKLVISFDEYDVTPGCMGVVEFEIPTSVLENILVSNEYIK